MTNICNVCGRPRDLVDGSRCPARAMIASGRKPNAVSIRGLKEGDPLVMADRTCPVVMAIEHVAMDDVLGALYGGGCRPATS